MRKVERLLTSPVNALLLLYAAMESYKTFHLGAFLSRLGSLPATALCAARTLHQLLVLGAAENRGEQIADRTMRFDGVSQTLVGINDVAVAPTDLQTGENAGFFQMGNQSKRCALRYAHTLCDIAKPSIGILRQANEYMRVIAEEIPLGIDVSHKLFVLDDLEIIRHSIQDINILLNFSCQKRSVRLNFFETPM